MTLEKTEPIREPKPSNDYDDDNIPEIDTQNSVPDEIPIHQTSRNR